MSSVARVCIYFLLASRFLICVGCGSFSATYEHPITLGIESQRIARNLAVFGIKNARAMSRRTGQHKFLLCGRIYQLISLSLSAGLLNVNISLGDNTIQLVSTLIRGLAPSSQQENLDIVRG